MVGSRPRILAAALTAAGLVLLAFVLIMSLVAKAFLARQRRKLTK